MKRNKEWWARLSPIERAALVGLEKAGSWAVFYPKHRDGFECGYCGVHGEARGGLCASCQERLDALIAKADGAPVE